MLVILVDLGPWLEERLHEQVQEGWHPDLRRGTLGSGLGGRPVSPNHRSLTGGRLRERTEADSFLA